MTESPIGRLLTLAALADVLAWIVLAFVVASISSGAGWSGFVITILGSLARLQPASSACCVRGWASCWPVTRPMVGRAAAGWRRSSSWFLARRARPAPWACMRRLALS